MLLMLMANASISSCSCWARTGAVAGASSRTAVAMLNAYGAGLTDSSSSLRASLVASATSGGTTDTSRASVQVMSTRSPTCSLARASLSATLEL